ncbi:unnamed protein product [Protopolystoma xenopodis]|uniref:Uncharacterized protein n=1 Tax=Protopolystoma xenopodis TaxID=117903 RepID=A0A448XKN7_9PLAT|nr:unnamed protein product [Protopolystoma xenopodis]
MTCIALLSFRPILQSISSCPLMGLDSELEPGIVGIGLSACEALACCRRACETMVEVVSQVHKTREQFGLDGPTTVHCK